MEYVGLALRTGNSLLQSDEIYDCFRSFVCDMLSAYFSVRKSADRTFRLYFMRSFLSESCGRERLARHRLLLEMAERHCLHCLRLAGDAGCSGGPTLVGFVSDIASEKSENGNFSGCHFSGIACREYFYYCGQLGKNRKD